MVNCKGTRKGQRKVNTKSTKEASCDTRVVTNSVTNSVTSVKIRGISSETRHVSVIGVCSRLSETGPWLTC